MALLAGGLFPLDVDELAGPVVRGVMTHAAAATLQAFGVDFMGKTDLGASQVPEDPCQSMAPIKINPIIANDIKGLILIMFLCILSTIPGF